MLQKLSTVTVTVEKFGDRGKSIARIEGFTIMVNGGVPGDKLLVRIIRKKRKYAEAEVVKVLEPSSLRTDPRCAHFGVCGGCKWQHVSYDSQLEAKRDSVRDAIVRIGKVEGAEVLPTIPAADIYYYRNKMEYSFGSKRWLTREEIGSGVRFEDVIAGGFHVSGNFSKVLNLTECHLQNPVSFEILDRVRQLGRDELWTAWDVRTTSGYLRHLVVRSSDHTGDIMLNLVTTGFDDDRIAQVAELLKESFPQVKTFVNTSNTGVAQTSYGETKLVFGPGKIIDRIGEYDFEISPHAFFQTNTKQAERLYEVVRDIGEFQPTDHLYDLYCGAGTISLFLSKFVAKVTGVEVIESAIENANTNAKMNGVENCTFVRGDMLKIMNDDLINKYGKPDVIVVDPPRSGMHPKVVKRLSDLRPDRLIYVSCNPRSQGRDIELMGDDWVVGKSQPVDMFPHTHHVENVVMLKPKSAG